MLKFLKFKKITGLEKRWLKNFVSVMVGLVILCVAGAILFITALHYTTLRSNLQTRAQTISKILQSHYGESETFLDSCNAYTKTFEDRDIQELQLYNLKGELIVSSASSPVFLRAAQDDVTTAIANGTLSVFQGRTATTRERYVSVSVPLFTSDNEPAGVLRFLKSLKEVDSQMFTFGVIALAIGIALIVCIIFVSRYFLQTILKPISDINSTAKRIAAGSYGAQITHTFDDEIGELADTINDMSVKISQFEKTQTEFISSVSHELRTPLTAISGWGETLLASENLDSETRRGMMIILREARRLTGMVEELLEFTRMQNGRFTLNVEQADLLAEFEDTVFMYASRLKQEDILLNYTPAEEPIPEIPCDVSRMRQVFLNILDNAAKHGGSGKQIDASITLEEQNVVIRIRDYGPGIPEDELPHVKMKFYKGSSKARGSGIGLAVCEEIVSMHGGTLSLENAVGGGTLVTVSIPSGKE